MAIGRGGNQSIFTPKAGGDRVQGIITRTGSRRFEAARRRLAHLSKWPVERVSDADTIEFLARGEADTIDYLERQPTEA